MEDTGQVDPLNNQHAMPKDAASGQDQHQPMLNNRDLGQGQGHAVNGSSVTDRTERSKQPEPQGLQGQDEQMTIPQHPASDKIVIDSSSVKDSRQMVDMVDSSNLRATSQPAGTHQEQSHPTADLSGPLLETDNSSADNNPASHSDVGPRFNVQTEPAAVPETSIGPSADVMEITPEAASLLPNPGILRAAPPMMEADPILPADDVDMAASNPSDVSEDNPTIPTSQPETGSHTDSNHPAHQHPPSNALEAAIAGTPIIPSTLSLSPPTRATHQPPPDDTTFSDTDSALGGMSSASSLTSVTSSIYAAIEEHGRTYHSFKAGKYVLPNDATEQARLDTQHQMFLLCNDGRLFLAPLDPTRTNRVLDIATGTGIWAIDFADDFPHAEVIGSDLSPIQPRWCPPNCHFEVDDAEDEWVWNEPFSYIHGRALLTCFEDPLDVIAKAYGALEPGGWLEFQDATFPFEYEDAEKLPRVEEGRMDRPYEYPLQRWEQITYEAGIAGGRRWDNVRRYKEMFERVGLVDVVEVRTKAPLGVINYRTGKPLDVWKGLSEKERQVGALHGPSMYNGLEGMSNRNFQRLDIPQEETDNIVKQARSVMTNNTVGAHNWVVSVYGRKPE